MNSKFGIKIIAISVFIAVTALCAFTPAQNKQLTDVKLNNIEALSSREESSIVCIGQGTIDCKGEKYEMKIIYSK